MFPLLAFLRQHSSYFFQFHFLEVIYVISFLIVPRVYTTAKSGFAVSGIERQDVGIRLGFVILSFVFFFSALGLFGTRHEIEQRIFVSRRGHV